MEHEKGLDLSLAPPCGGSNYSLKDNYNGSSCIKPDEGDRGSKLINEFRNFLEGGNHPHPLKSEENFCTNFGKSAVDLETSRNLNTVDTWMKNDGRPTVVEEERRSDVGEKRKSLFGDECRFQKKHERETNNLDLTEKTRATHISINSDDGSTAENEEIADSDMDGSTSKQVSELDGLSKCFLASGSTSGCLSRVQKEIHAFDDLSGIEHSGQKRFTVSSDKEFNMTSLPSPYVSFPTQSGKMGKDYSQVGMPCLSGYSLPGMMNTSSATTGVQPVVPASFPMMVGYTHMPVPADKDNIRSILSHHQHSSYSPRNPLNPDLQNDSRKLNQVIMPKPCEATQYDERAVEHDKRNGKHHIGEHGSFSNIGGSQKGSNTVYQLKDATEKGRSDSFPYDYPAIRSGIAADLKFGGSGSYPNLPWVSTSGPGPNGRTISGVTYRFSPTQLRIVCACHGSHMSPEEFIQHASQENASPDSGNGPISLPNSNPAASGQN